MKYRIVAKAWTGYGKNELPSTVTEADVSVPGEDSGRSRGVALNTLDQYLRQNDRNYRVSTSQTLAIEPV